MISMAATMRRKKLPRFSPEQKPCPFFSSLFLARKLSRRNTEDAGVITRAIQQADSARTRVLFFKVCLSFFSACDSEIFTFCLHFFLFGKKKPERQLSNY